MQYIPIWKTVIQYITQSTNRNTVHHTFEKRECSTSHNQQREIQLTNGSATNPDRVDSGLPKQRPLRDNCMLRSMYHRHHPRSIIVNLYNYWIHFHNNHWHCHNDHQNYSQCCCHHGVETGALKKWTCTMSILSWSSRASSWSSLSWSSSWSSSTSSLLGEECGDVTGALKCHALISSTNTTDSSRTPCFHHRHHHRHHHSRICKPDPNVLTT